MRAAARLTTDGRRVDDRRNKRSPRRLMVRYGAHGLERTAFTRNISETGVFLQTNAVFQPGQTIQVQISFPGRTWELWARVAWAKKVPPNLAHVLECGMGLQFVNPGEEWVGFFQNWRHECGMD
jgi:Tfp pilus assembly protein PilZ